jgi:hypothetical protein
MLNLPRFARQIEHSKKKYPAAAGDKTPAAEAAQP